MPHERTVKRISMIWRIMLDILMCVCPGVDGATCMLAQGASVQIPGFCGLVISFCVFVFR